MDREAAEEVLADAFEELAVALHGIFAIHEVDDEVIWQTAKRISVIHRKARRAIRNSGPDPSTDSPDRTLEPHPAIVELLAQIRRDRGALCREKAGAQ